MRPRQHRKGGKRCHKRQAADQKERQFVENRPAMLDALEQSLVTETYRFGPFHSFTVKEPKERRIDHPDIYPDKILHNCAMNIVAPVLCEKFTADTYGSIKGRGIKKAADKLKSIARQSRLVLCADRHTQVLPEHRPRYFERPFAPGYQVPADIKAA